MPEAARHGGLREAKESKKEEEQSEEKAKESKKEKKSEEKAKECKKKEEESEEEAREKAWKEEEERKEKEKIDQQLALLDEPLRIVLGSMVTQIKGVKAEVKGVKAEVKGVKAELEEVKVGMTRLQGSLDRVHTSLAEFKLLPRIPALLLRFTPHDLSKPELKPIQTIAGQKIWEKNITDESWAEFVQYHPALYSSKTEQEFNVICYLNDGTMRRPTLQSPRRPNVAAISPSAAQLRDPINSICIIEFTTSKPTPKVLEAKLAQMETEISLLRAYYAAADKDHPERQGHLRFPEDFYAMLIFDDTSAATKGAEKLQDPPSPDDYRSLVALKEVNHFEIL